jgi:hypothetical protein
MTSLGRDLFFSFPAPVEEMDEQRFEKGNTKDGVGKRDIKNLSGKKFFRKIPYFLGSPFHLLFIHHRHLFEDGFTITAV